MSTLPVQVCVTVYSLANDSSLGVFKLMSCDQAPSTFFVKGGMVDRVHPHFAYEARRSTSLPTGSQAVERANSTLKLIDADQRQSLCVLLVLG